MPDGCFYIYLNTEMAHELSTISTTKLHSAWHWALSVIVGQLFHDGSCCSLSVIQERSRIHMIVNITSSS